MAISVQIAAPQIITVKYRSLIWYKIGAQVVSANILKMLNSFVKKNVNNPKIKKQIKKKTR